MHFAPVTKAAGTSGNAEGWSRDIDAWAEGLYTDEIREIERRIQIAAGVTDKVPVLDLPPGVDVDSNRSRACTRCATR